MHLIADYGDGSDGDRGIMGDANRTGNAALSDLGEVEKAVQTLVAEAHLEEGEGLPAGEAVTLEAALFEAGGTKVWWQALAEDMVSGEVGDNTMEKIFDMVVPWGVDLKGTSALMGGPMTQTLVSFVWARDPVAGPRAVEAAIRQASEEISAAARRLKIVGWRQNLITETP